jgi:trigger factor
VTQIKQQMALDAVVEAEKIEVSDEDVDAEVKKAAANMNVPYERIIEGLDFAGLKADLARDRAMDAVATAAKPNMIAAEADNGEIKITEVTKEEVEAEKAEKKAAKKTTKKSEEAAEGEEKKPARKPRAKKAAAEGEEAAAPKKTTRKKKADAEEAKGEE